MDTYSTGRFWHVDISLHQVFLLDGHLIHQVLLLDGRI